jgi:hypothetical protein
MLGTIPLAGCGSFSPVEAPRPGLCRPTIEAKLIGPRRSLTVESLFSAIIVIGSAVVSQAEPKSGCGVEDVTSPRRRFSLIESADPSVFECDDAVDAAGEVEIVGGDQPPLVS